MGYIKKKIGDISNVPYVTFECDTVADVAAIDVSNVVMGSRCYVVDTGATYALNSDREWKEVPLGGGAKNWDELENKPFYEKTVTTVTPGLNITWDGNTSGLAMFTVGREKLYHVSNLTPTLEQLQTAELVWSNINTGEPNGDIWYGSEYTVIENTEQVLTLSRGGARGAGAIGVVYNESYGYPTGVYLPFFFGDILFVSSLTSADVEITNTEIKTIDPKYLPQTGGGASSWNDLEDKPFYEETVTTVTAEALDITWDGNTSGLANFAGAGRDYVYKVSDVTPPLEQLQTATIIIKNTTGGSDTVYEMSGATIKTQTEQVLILSGAGPVAVVYDEAYGHPTGLYLPVLMGGMMYCSSITAPEISETVSEVKTIDNKFLPEHLQFGIEESVVNLQWDGNKDGKEVAVFKDGWVDINLYKVSDKVFTADELKNITVLGNNRPEQLELYEEPVDSSSFLGLPCTLICVSGINTSMNPALVSIGGTINVSTEYEKAIFPSAGTYLADMSDPVFGYWEFEDTYVPVGYITSVKGEDVVKTLDSKYLPEALQFGEEVALVEKTSVLVKSGTNIGTNFDLEIAQAIFDDHSNGLFIVDDTSYPLSDCKIEESDTRLKFNISESSNAGFYLKLDNGKPTGHLWYTGFYDTPSISITAMVEQIVVKKLDTKYLPDDIGNVQTVNNIEPDENGNIQLPEGFSGEWDDLKNKPFYDETITTVTKGLNIQWDGDITDLPSMFASGMDYSYRVSDVTPTIEELKKATIVYVYPDTGEEESFSLSTFDSIRKNTAQILHVVKRHHIMVVYDESYGYPTGLYLPRLNDKNRGRYISSLTSPDETETVTNFKALDEKFLPEGTVTSSNISEYLPDGIGGDTSWNDLLDKPFGDVENLVDDTDYSFEIDSNNSNRYKYNYNRTNYPKWLKSLSLNDEVVIEWDGVRYNCVYLYDNYLGSYYIGNYKTIRQSGTDTGEPFGILFNSGTQEGGMYTFDTNTSHKIKVFTFSTIKIDEKYLPEPEMESNAGTYVFLDTEFNDTIRQEVLDALNSGKMVYCKSKQDVSPDSGHVYMPLVYFEQLTSNSYNFRFFAAKPNITYNPTGIATNVDFHFALTNGTTLVKKKFTHTFS